LARRQNGVVSRRQLLALGYTEKSIEHRLKSGRLHLLMRGVYAVGRREVGPEGWWVAAVLVCGDGAVLSHRSAAALFGIGTERLWERTRAGTRHLVEVSVPRPTQPRHPGVRARRRAALRHESVTVHRGIPVTGIVQTLVDLATELPSNRLERAINEADKHDLIDPESLRRAIEAYSGEPGIRALRQVLDKDTFLLSDDELELLFHPLARASGLPLPRSKEMLNGFEVDFYWPDLGLVVETDGWRYHRTASAQTRDALRFQLHTASGLTPLRFSHWQVKHEPGHVVEILTRTAAHLTRPARTHT
jgi:very-short-patch-repair endonuclease